jgi:uncharacterized membrane protein YeaQ/YmgE (transglycosylase-associated protein family)
MLGFIIAGLVIGALARLLKPGKQHLSIWMTLLLGLAGSIVGGGVSALLGTGDIWELNILGFVVAVIAAVALVGVAEELSHASPPRSRPALEARLHRRPASPLTTQEKEEIR